MRGRSKLPATHYSVGQGMRNSLWGRRATRFVALVSLLVAQLPVRANDLQIHEAAMQLQAQHNDAAIKLLKAVLAREPENYNALRMLSRAYILAKQDEQALPILTKLLALRADAPREMLDVAAIRLKQHEKDAALDWLQKVAATKRFDMPSIEFDPRFDELHSDTRFAGLLRASDSPSKLFVEDVKIIGEWDGEGANDQFGWIARSLGDVDGDGVADFVTSAPTRKIGGDNAGKVYVYSTRSKKLLWSVDGQPGDQLGSGLESAGDTDGDGIQDVIASAPDHDKAFVYSGKDGHTLLSLTGEAAGDAFGNHVSSVGDIDGDGHADVIVGAPGNNASGKGAGSAYVYSGKDGHLLLALRGEHEGDGFGSAVSGYSDAKNHFIVVGAPGAGARKTGRVYVYANLSAKPKFTFDSDETGRQLGYMFVSVLGDVDADGVPDIFASDWSNDSAGPAAGRVYVYSGRTGRRIHAFSGDSAGEGFGTTESIAGDVDGDGAADLIVGSWQYSVDAISGGKARLYSGKTGKLLRAYTSRVPGETFGFDAVGLGDVDGDGSIDFLITSGWSPVHGYHSGRVFIISSGIAAHALFPGTSER